MPNLMKEMTELKKLKFAALIVAAGLATTLAVAGPAGPAAAATTCSPSMSYEVDGWSGTVILYPRATCNGALQTLAIYGTAADTGETRSILYTHTSAGSYSGYGVAVPNRGPGTYCMGITIIWTLPNSPFEDDVSAQGCVQI